jgi:polyribonucleotide nucleotidyltransferase
MGITGIRTCLWQRINPYRDGMSEHAPRLIEFKINPDKILIGWCYHTLDYR